MKTIHIKEAFEGYPLGGKEGEKPTKYAVGQEPEVSDDFAELVVGKGHAREVKPAEPAEGTAGEKKGRKS